LIFVFLPSFWTLLWLSKFASFIVKMYGSLKYLLQCLIHCRFTNYEHWAPAF
jgi:hypothetical protein